MTRVRASGQEQAPIILMTDISALRTVACKCRARATRPTILAFSALQSQSRRRQRAFPSRELAHPSRACERFFHRGSVIHKLKQYKDERRTGQRPPASAQCCKTECFCQRMRLLRCLRRRARPSSTVPPNSIAMLLGSGTADTRSSRTA
jgi:hypothetical protein